MGGERGRRPACPDRSAPTPASQSPHRRRPPPTVPPWRLNSPSTQMRATRTQSGRKVRERERRGEARFFFVSAPLTFPPTHPLTGIERLCADLGLDPTDRRVLLLAWKAGASRQGFFTRGELTRAGAALRAPTFRALAAALPALATATDASPGALADFMAFAFKYCLTEPGQRILDLETATALLGIALPPSNPHTNPLLQYVTTQKDAKSVTADTWAGIARFVTAVDGPCTKHDDGDAWPLLLDNYVAWVRGEKGKKGVAEGA